MKLAFPTALAVFTLAMIAGEGFRSNFAQAADVPQDANTVSPAMARTEGRVLDATCNCEVPTRNNLNPVDPELMRKIREQAGNPKDEAKKLMAKVKSYRCPRIKPPSRDRDDFDMDEMEELDSSEILDELIARAGVNENYLDSEDRDRAGEMLDRKVAKCNEKIAKQMMKNSNRYSADSSSQSSNSSSMMMLRLAQMMQMMNSQYNNSGFGLFGYNPYLNNMNGGLAGYSPLNAMYAGRGLTNGASTGIVGYSPVNTMMAANTLGVNNLGVNTLGLSNSGYLPYYSAQNTGYLNNYLWGYAR